ncbi:MAG: ArsR/SmtB family transcription factor, partial [Planctomycetota bacterium]
MTPPKNPRPRLSDDVFASAAPVLRVLGHADRLRIVDLLMREDVTVAEIAERLELAPNAASQHLNMMTAHGVLRRRR